MKSQAKGFTLIELLIVIGIIAILAVVVLLTLNPAELLKQARDSNRIQDLASVNSALGLYLADQSSLPTDPIGANTTCFNTASANSLDIPATSECGLRYRANPAPTVWSVGIGADRRAINGDGWIPVNFGTISSGAPLPTLPVDPSNATSTTIGANYFYTYRASSTIYKLTARFESAKFSGSAGTDGGNFPLVYEVGSVTQL